MDLRSTAFKARKLLIVWLRGWDLNPGPLGYEPNELPDCSTPHFDNTGSLRGGQCEAEIFAGASPEAVRISRNQALGLKAGLRLRRRRTATTAMIIASVLAIKTIRVAEENAPTN